MKEGSMFILIALAAVLAVAGLSMAVDTTPVASIETIEPSPAYDTQTVRFEGNWEYDGDIDDFLWESDLDGFLSWDASFDMDGLSVGTHVISFKVMTDESVWSEPVNTTLEVVDYVLEVPPWKKGDCWQWLINMKQASGATEEMYVIEEVMNVDADYNGYPCTEINVTYTMEGDDEIITGKVWLSKDTQEMLGYETSDLDEPFGAFSFLELFMFPVDVSDGNMYFETNPMESMTIEGGQTFDCVELDSHYTDITIKYSPEAKHILKMDMELEGEVMVFTMKEAMDIEAVYSVLPEANGKNNGGNGGGGGSDGDSGGLDPMYITMGIIVVVIVVGAVLFVAMSRRKELAPASQQAPVFQPPTKLSEGSVTDGTYTFQVEKKEEGPAQATDSFLAFQGPPGSLGGPASPTTVAASVGDVGAPEGFRVVPEGPKVKLFWAPSKVEGGASISFYKVYRGTTPSEMSVYQTVGSEVLNFEDDNIVESTVYHYKVSAETISGEGPASPIIATVQAVPPKAPVYPGSRVSGSNVFLEWKPPPNDGGSPLTGYQVHRGPSMDALVEVASIDATDRVYADTGVEAGTHYYAITAETASGRSSMSKVVEVQVGGPGE